MKVTFNLTDSYRGVKPTCTATQLALTVCSPKGPKPAKHGSYLSFWDVSMMCWWWHISPKRCFQKGSFGISLFFTTEENYAVVTSDFREICFWNTFYCKCKQNNSEGKAYVNTANLPTSDSSSFLYQYEMRWPDLFHYYYLNTISWLVRDF